MIDSPGSPSLDNLLATGKVTELQNELPPSSRITGFLIKYSFKIEFLSPSTGFCNWKRGLNSGPKAACLVFLTQRTPTLTTRLNHPGKLQVSSWSARLLTQSG